MGPIGGAILQGAVQTGLNAVSGGLSYVWQKKLAEKQHEYNRELMQYQDQLQQASIDKQNAYNTPLAQMERYKEAGLNPNLVYGQGTPGNQSSVSKVSSHAPANYQNIQSPTSKLFEGVNVLNSIIQLRENLNKTRESNARANLMDVQAQYENWKYLHLGPLQKREYVLKNLGLGYDNDVRYYRSLNAKDFVDAELRYQTNLADKMWSDSMLSYFNVQREPHRWKFEQLERRLAIKKERQAIKNMEWQDKMYQLTHNFEKWAKPTLIKAGIIPGVNHTDSASSSHGIHTPFGGGNASQSSSHTRPVYFHNYGY